MVYLIIGTIVSLVGIGLMQTSFPLVGMILLIIGASIIFKGRRGLDRMTKG